MIAATLGWRAGPLARALLVGVVAPLTLAGVGPVSHASGPVRGPGEAGEVGAGEAGAAGEGTGAPDDADLVRVALVLEIEVEDPNLEAALREASEAALAELVRAHDLVRVDQGAALTIAARLWQPEPDAFVIDAVVELDGEAIAEQEGVVCMGCAVDELAAASLALLPDAAAEARARRAAATPEPAPAPAPTPAPVPGPARRRPALGPVGYAGIAAAGLGLGSSVAGALFLHRGRVIDGDPGSPVLTYTDYRPLGVGLLGAGLGAMVVGNVLLGVDLGLLRPRRDRASAARFAVTGLGLGLGGRAGLSVRGRF